MNVVIRRTWQLVALAGAVVAMAGSAAAQDRLIQSEKDLATGATVRLYRTDRGPRIDIDTPAIRLQKQQVGNKVVTSLRGAGQSLVIEFDGRTFSVSGSGGRATTTLSDRVGFARVQAIVAKSPLATRATGLIARMGFGVDSPIQPMLLTTRMLLLALTNDHSGVRDIGEWMRQARSRLVVVNAALDDRTPGECWKEYVKEAVEAWAEYEKCMKDAKWWDVFSEVGCTIVYDLRALGAFSWWLDCVKLTSIIKG